MKKIYLFRHGLTAAVKNNVSYGDQIYTAEILPEAVPVIERMADFFKEVPDSLNLTSPFKRCVQTSQIITDITGKEFVADPRLNEVSAGMNELPNQFINRIKSIYAEVEASTFENILICTHSAGLSALIKLLTHSRWPWFMMRTINPGELIICEGRKLSMIDFNALTSDQIPETP